MSRGLDIQEHLLCPHSRFSRGNPAVRVRISVVVFIYCRYTYTEQQTYKKSPDSFLFAWLMVIWAQIAAMFLEKK